MDVRSFERFAGALAFAVAIGGLAYSILFVIAVKAQSDGALTATWLLLLFGGVASTAVAVAVYQRLREGRSGLALWGLLLWVGGAFGSILHAGFDLALDAQGAGGFSLPNYADPRGLATFGLTGAGVLVIAAAIRRSAVLPPGVGMLGAVLGVLLILTYLGRLLIVDPNHPLLLGVAAVTGVIVHPVWFIWLGRSLRRALAPSAGQVSSSALPGKH